MKKILSFLICAALVMGCCSALVGCAPEAETSREVFFYPLEITEQPNRDTDVSDGGNGALEDVTLCLARNEHEFAQIVVRPSRDVTSLKMEISALTDENGNVFDGDVTLYRAHYVQYCNDGVYRPCALIPLFDGSDGAMATDTVSVNANENQAFYIELLSTASTKAGTYTGTVTFTYDGVSESVAVSATVWDFELPESSSLKTYYGFWTTMVESWYETWHPDTEIDLNEKCNEYRDFLRSYRLSVGANSFDYDTAEEWAQEIRREVDEGVLSMASVPIYYAEDDVWSVERCAELNQEKFEMIVKYGLLDNVWVYVVDEPYWPEAYAKANRIEEILQLSGLGVKQMVTTHYQPGLIENIDIWCPTEAYLTKDDVDAAHARGQDFWTYCLVEFTEENDTYDRYRMWTYEYMQVDGYLMWLTNLFMRFDINGSESNSEYVDRDIWANGATWGTDSGQAVYFYPCTADDGVVGRDMAIPTVDLFTECTGLEDYEYFHLLREKVTALAEELDVAVEIDDVLYSYYAPVLSGADRDVVSSDAALGNIIRQTAAADILSTEKAISVVSKTVTADGEETSLTVYAKQGSVVKDGAGNTLTPDRTEGNADIYVVPCGDADSVTVTINGTAMTRVLSPMRDYDVYLKCLDMVRLCAGLLSVDAEVYEDELYDSLMESKYVLRDNEKTRAFAASMTDLNIPMVYYSKDCVTVENGTSRRTLVLTVPDNVDVSVDGVTVLPTDATEKSNCRTYEVDVDCPDLCNFFTVTLVFGEMTQETTVCVMQHAVNGRVVVDTSSDSMKDYAAETDGLTASDEGLRFDVGMNGTQIVNLSKDVLLCTDLADCNTLRMTVTNPTDNDLKGVTVTAMFFFKASATTGVIPAHSSVTLDINLNTVDVEKRNALSKITVACDLDEDVGTYIIGDLYAFGVQ